MDLDDDDDDDDDDDVRMKAVGNLQEAWHCLLTGDGDPLCLGLDSASL